MKVVEVAVGLLKFAQSFIADRTAGATYPGKSQRLPERDAREHALAALRDYLAAVPISDPENANGVLRIAKDDVHAEAADAEHVPTLPACGVVSSESTFASQYLGGQVDLEDTFGVYGCNTVLSFVGWHREIVSLEIWCKDVPQRRAVVAALKAAFCASEGRGSVDLKLPAYFDRLARFTLIGANVVDEPESLRGGRRRAFLKLELLVAEVLLLDAGTMRPVTRVEVV